MTDVVHGAAPEASRVGDAYRWTQLAVGVGAMVMIATISTAGHSLSPTSRKNLVGIEHRSNGHLRFL